MHSKRLGGCQESLGILLEQHEKVPVALGAFEDNESASNEMEPMEMEPMEMEPCPNQCQYVSIVSETFLYAK